MSLDALFTRQHEASRRHPAPDLQARRASLLQLEQLVSRNAEALIMAIDRDFGGRSRTETELLEMLPTLRALRHARAQVGRWMRPRRQPVEWLFRPGRNQLRHDPLGVIGIMAPWNYPLLLTLGPLCDALAAGNRALLKPSELTPLFSELLQRLIAEAFDPAEVAVVTGGVEVGQAFASLPFDHLVFTGSTAVGRKVMQAAAANLTPVTLELGGKSPAIVAPDHAIEDAARSIAFGKFVNAGQTCIAPDYALVPAQHLESFAEAVLRHVRRTLPEPGRNPDYSAIISPTHRARLHALLDEARASGARVHSSAELPRDDRHVAPTVVLAPGQHLRLMQEEIFGPILPIVPYQNLDEALALVARHERPLALYLFTHRRSTRERVLAAAPSGGVTLNGTLLHIAQHSLPFGGIGPSGIGAYHGEAGFLRFSHARGVHQVGPINPFETLGPPWGRLARWMGRWQRGG